MTLRPLLFSAPAGGAACEVCPQESAMVQIVVYLRRREYREFRIDGEREARVRCTQGSLDLVSAIGAREDESEVARALGQRQQQLIRLRRDSDVVHAGHLTSGVDALHAAEDAAPWNRDHHDTGRVGLAAPRAGIFAERVTQEKFLQTDCGLRIADC